MSWRVFWTLIGLGIALIVGMAVFNVLTTGRITG